MGERESGEQAAVVVVDTRYIQELSSQCLWTSLLATDNDADS